MKTFRIFISSPGDVGLEREISGRVIRRLDGELIRRARLEPYFWEHEPMRATADFQAQIPAPSQFDIVICILWSRLGSRLHAQHQRPDGTSYASGTEYEFEEAARGFREHGTPELLVYRRSQVPSFPPEPDEVLQERLRQWKALQAFTRRWFIDASEGTFQAAFNTYADVADFEAQLEQHLRKLVLARLQDAGVAGAVHWAGAVGAIGHNAASAAAPAPVAAAALTSGSPFRGLEAYAAEHAALFFGRTRAIDEVLAALKAQAALSRAFVLVCGASGSGKSSLVRAGVVPLLVRPGVVEGIGLWRSAELRPGAAGGTARLLTALAGSLCAAGALPELTADGTSVEALGKLLAEMPESVVSLVKGGLSQAARETQIAERLPAQPVARLVLVLDQLEALWARDERAFAVERDLFFRAVSALARSGLVWVMATLRSDFYHRTRGAGALSDLSRDMGLYDLQPPTSAEIGQMVRMPAQAAGVAFEVDETSGAALDDVLRDAAAASPGALPLLSFVLDELYRRGAGRGLLTHADFAALGGLAGALARRAELAHASCSPAARRALGSLFARLATVDAEQGAGFVRRATPADAIAATPAERELVDALIAGRLLQAREGVVEVAHEALFTHWPAVRALLEKDREFLRVRARLAVPCQQWVEEGKRTDRLVQDGKPLLEARELAARPADLTPALKEFVTASLAAARRRETARRIRVWLSIAALLGITVGSVTATVAITRAWRTADALRRDADEQGARLAVERGLELARRGETGRALLWFARGARQAPADGSIAHVARENLVLWRQRASALVRFWEHPAALADVALSGNGTVAAIARVHDRVDLVRLDREREGGATAAAGAGSPGVAADGAHPAPGLAGLAPALAGLAPARIGELVAAPGAVVGEVASIDVAPDGALGVTADGGSALAFWTASGRPAGHSEPGGGTSVLAFSPDGSHLLVGGVDGVARVLRLNRDVGGGVAPVVVETVRHGSPISGVSWGESGSFATGGGVECTVWPPVAPKPSGREARSLQQIRVSAGNVRAVALLSGGEVVATAGEDGLVRCWELARGRSSRPELRVADPGQGLVFAPDGSAVAGGRRDFASRVLDPRTGSAIGQPLEHGASARASAFSRGGRRLLTGGNDRMVRVWELARPVLPERELDLRDPIRGLDGGRRKVVAVDWDASGFLEARTADREVRVLNATATPTPTADASPDGTEPRDAVIARAPGSGVVLVEQATGVVVLRDAAGSTPLPDAGRVLHAALGARGTLWLTDQARAGARLWARSVGSHAAPLTSAPLPGTGRVRASAFSPDGRWLAAGREQGVALIALDPDPGIAVAGARMLPHPGGLVALSFSGDGARLVSGGADSTARVWDLIRGRQLGGALVHRGAVLAVALSVDGERVLTGSDDGSARVWTAATGEPIGGPIATAGAVTGVAFAPGGTQVLTGSADGAVQAWDMATGLRIGPALEQPAGVTALALRQDAAAIATGGADGVLRTWATPWLVEHHADIGAGPAADLAALAADAERVNGLELDRAGAVRMLTVAEWNQRISK